MPKSKKAYVAALPLSAIPELRDLLDQFCGISGRRGNVVMVRLADEAVHSLDQLVEAGLFGSRSEAAAFLIGAGIDAQKELLKKVNQHSAEIRRIRQSLRKAAVEALRSTDRPSGVARPKK